MTELKNEVISLCMLYGNDPEVRKYLIALEKVSFISSFTNMVIENNFFLKNYENIFNSGELKGQEKEPENKIMRFLFEVSNTISLRQKWDDVERFIKDCYVVAVSLDRINDKKFKTLDLKPELFQDRLWLTVILLITFITEINININNAERIKNV